MPEPNPEQTCSILSRMVFAFLDSVIWEGYRTPHLTVEQLPPLCDYERMKYMSKRSFPVSHYYHEVFFANADQSLHSTLIP